MLPAISILTFLKKYVPHLAIFSNYIYKVIKTQFLRYTIILVFTLYIKYHPETPFKPKCKTCKNCLGMSIYKCGTIKKSSFAKTSTQSLGCSIQSNT